MQNKTPLNTTNDEGNVVSDCSFHSVSAIPLNSHAHKRYIISTDNSIFF